MPVRMDTSRCRDDHPANAASPSSGSAGFGPRPAGSQPAGPCVSVGLVNNMPAAAFAATERQFLALLNSASGDIPVRLSLYTLPGKRLSELEANQGDSCYASVETLWKTTGAPPLDGLIVTGTEPIMPDLRDEPYWTSFTELLEWARVNTYSAVWSCLAAHAAVLHMDGIGRRKREAKRSGIYGNARVSEHWLTSGASPAFHVPHSRWNGLAASELVDRGYDLLTCSDDGEVDTFVKGEQSLFVFFQGHPEYESDTLLREYRRDVGRYLRSEIDTYPTLPRDYFDAATEQSLHALREQALSCRSRDLLGHVAAVLQKTRIENTWHASAAQVYRNWLQYLCERKSNAMLVAEQAGAVPAGL